VRRAPAPRGARADVSVEIGEPWAAADLDDRDRWLTARWRLYSRRAEGLRYARADHPVWPLHHARLVRCEQDVLQAAGLPAPRGEPLVHWSPGVDVRISLPHRVIAV
jgi:uncharacterized protein YqjF (DUF2071 family)